MKRILFILGFMFVANLMFSQLNPEFTVVKGQKGEITNFTFKSLGSTPFIENSTSFQYGTLNFTPLGNNEFNLAFEPEFYFTGQAEVVVEYYGNGPIPGFPAVFYSTLRYEIKPSIVNTTNEVFLVNTDSVILDLSSNDSSSAGSILLSDIVYSKGGISSIGSDGNLSFSFDPNATHAFVGYVVTDANGISESAIARIFKGGTIVQDEVHLSLNNKEVLDFYLLDSSFEINTLPAHGTYDSEDWLTFTYDPENDFVGEDLIAFSNDAGSSCNFNINVVQKDLKIEVTQDDYVSTSVNESVTFNVFENDFRSNLTIVTHSPELVYLGNGDFIYTPAENETGVNIFDYKIFSGLNYHEAKVFVSIDDYKPVSSLANHFDVVAGNTFILSHNAPISSYSFDVLTQPLHGIISILSGGSQVPSNCGEEYILKESSIEYLAEPGYTGEDAFEVNYCTQGGNCHIVKVDLTIVEDDGSCVCDIDCVWPGDFNNDGIVNMKDLINFGINVGEKGAARMESGSTSWQGFASEDWGYLNHNLQSDLKHLDANGDGVVSIDDADAIADNYGKQNRLLSNDVLAVVESPLNLSTEQVEVDSGEWLILDVSLGDDDAPFVDFYGLSFEFNIDEGLIDETSACFQMADGAWIGYDSPMLEVFEQVQPGKFRVGFSRLTSLPISGSGEIGVFKFVVTEEINGFRDTDGKLVLNLGFENTTAYDHTGKAFGLTSNKVKVTLNNTSERVNPFSFKSYPNPVSDLLTIETNRVIENIVIIDVVGRVVDQITAPKSPNFRIPFNQYPDGIYFVKATSKSETFTRKVSHYRTK